MKNATTVGAGSVGANPAKKVASYRLAGMASMAGTTIEWYDFFLYGTAAALIFGKIFFPALDPITGVLAAFATYAVGFLGRPLGGIIFGHFGDRIGRKSMLLLTLMMMGIPTIVIGLIPSYDQIGYWSALILVLMRFLQGMAVGGEWGGAVLMAVEHAPEGKKGFYGSLPQTGVGAGLVLASLAMGLVAKLPEADMLSWGWRLPFVASVVLLGIGWLIRLKVPESPAFEKIKAQNTAVKVPLFQVLRKHPRETLTIIGARTAENAWFYMSVTFALAYAANQLQIPRADVLNAITCGAVLSLFTMPFCGYLSDKVGQRRLYFAGLLLLCAFIYPFFAMLETREPVWVWWAMVLAVGVVFPIMYAPESLLFARQFPAEIRYSGISVSVQLAGVLGGGFAPMIATKLLTYADGSPHYVIVYLLGMAVIALFCTALMKPDPARYHAP
ncbi:MFS transporter [Pseudomonas sp. 10B1]|uniref:MFS transporter n=1 Tax=unclassified Pseudomonas TaxID=196821 RepID=UPI002AB39D7C|nr:MULTISPECIES: MFS transporter [unclassified Pseudomonas]MDY7563268.1 MFS transporter [Pseudomonas sp. AB6]MEA9979198.1 MFS transporter [Pseudomonas sp. RTS4]MEA9996973.1 MFS transporter [Pseudomonas sp. AA4]MEB0089135.1 MFS transporter [Pseudomonas sp. RTI1]MEB0127228.1 MFS transporter [Pseudomonas sp. CCC1.2]